MLPKWLFLVCLLPGPAYFEAQSRVVDRCPFSICPGLDNLRPEQLPGISVVCLYRTNLQCFPF